MSPAPLTTARNDYYNNTKNSSIYTPLGVCQFIFDLIDNETHLSGNVLDTCVGTGNLLKGFFDSNPCCNYKWTTLGIDIHNIKNRKNCHYFLRVNYLEWSGYFNGIHNIDLVIQNPPFNNTPEIKEFLKSIKKGKALLPELFLDKTWELFGNDIPCICFSPMGILLNQRTFSRRWKKMRDTYPDITSIISLPLNIFPGVEFHNQILIFNIPGLKSHYFLPEKYLPNGGK